ncbi:kinase non-catalytic C-lobe domain-containing protein 1 isoform X1 [Oryctolagus cuniculus]|uniref:kinase non-catalytic C-lobe domain-containing protein 1 isoform X1 n=1 Tax=Oryctolagus cuniculus TaxID=9986 RepID=UPI002231771A|nr:kinase non-catalytic C-lobe domain-containing protein 1 isoform X3 [Oryctolagus cuniculus]
MEPASGFCEEDKDLDFYDFEPLPTLPEDEENVSLADILSLRARGLSEQEAWAVCLECSLAMHSVAHSPLFRTLCITPDTLAFNTSGNVCFMEQLSDDPEGAFVPPELDVTGNTFEAHIYSLGATLKAALDYAVEPEPEPRLSAELETLLSQMQAEEPADRPRLESVIALCREKTRPASSCHLCRSLSAVGRRVLSIESFGALQDMSDSTWKAVPVPRSVGPRRPPGDLGTDLEGLPQPPISGEPSLRHRPLPPKPLPSAPMKNGDSHCQEGLASLVLGPLSPLGELDRDLLKRSHLQRTHTSPRLLPEGPEATASGPGAQLPPPASSPAGPRKAVLDGRNGLSRGKELEQEPQPQHTGAPGPGFSGDGGPKSSRSSQGPAEQRSLPCPEATQGAGSEAETPMAGEETPGVASPEQDLSLQDLLCKLGRPFREYELWALCLACLRALQVPTEPPAYLCPDSVLVAEDGTVLLRPAPDNGPRDSFFLAPEAAEQKLVTEKASMYCVAAVLWTAAKFSVPRDHKLTLPRRLRTLLLDMARRCAPERPSAAEAIKVCGSYLLQRGMDSRKILAHLRASTCKGPVQVPRQEETITLQKPRPGFLPVVGSDARLLVVPGPVPAPPSCDSGAQELPAAFTSEATHFRPVVLAQDAGEARERLTSSPGLAESPKDKEGEGWPGTQVLSEAPSLKTADLPTPKPGPQGVAADPPGELGLPSLAEGGCCAPAPTPALPPDQGMEGQDPPVATSPREPTLADRSPRHPRKPPRHKATERQGPEPESAHSTPRGTARAAATPDSPGSTSARGHGDPERPRPAERRPCPSSVDAPSPPRTACRSLQEATRLIQEEFACDGYLDNGLEALIMGEYIHALRDLTFATFCGAVAEKFCDLSWEERLLRRLFQVVNGGSPQEQGPSSMCPGSCSLASKRPSLPGSGKEKPSEAWVSGAPCPPPALADLDTDGLSRGNLEVGFRSQKSVKGAREQQLEADAGGQQGSVPEPSSGASEAGAVARLARPQEGGLVASPGPAEFRSCSPGWSSAFYEADCFGPDVHNYVKDLGRQKAGGCPEPEAQSPELEQQLLIEKRNYRKTLKFYQKLSQKEKRSKGSEVRSMLSKLRGQLEEMRAKVQLLGLVKKYLQVLYAERWGLEPCALPAIVNIAATPGDTLDFSPLDESSSLIFYNVSKQPGGGRQKAARVLQAGTPLGLMAYLYSSNAFLEGYVQQFLYTFRYFCTPHDFLHFLLDRISSTLSRAHQDPSSTLTKIYRRSLCVLQAWLEDCYTVDFTRNTELLRQLQDFLSSKILPLDGSAEHLLGLLEVGMDRRAEGAPRGMDLEDPKEAEEDTSPFNALCKRLSEDGISRKGFPWRLPRGNGLALPQHKRRPYSIASALPKPCFCEDFYGPYSKASEKGPYFLTEYSTRQLFTQLTLLQQELFQKCHPVHFLNSRALGVTDKSTAIPKASASEPLSAKPCSLFLSSCPQDRYLLQLLRHADDVGTWVAAEIATSHTPKLQVNLLSRFLLIAKSCYEQRNFATAMQILGGLEHLAVRQSPAWRILPAKMAEIMEELKAVEVFLKSDSLCLMEGRRFRAQPTLPSARLLAMHVQQLETGGFTMTNGAHRWSKLRSIARVVSQVHAFQENPYTFSPDPKLQAHLRRRIARFSGADVAVLAADSRANSLPVPSEKHARKIQDKLRRMKATFQ